MKTEKISKATNAIFTGLQLVMVAAVIYGDTPWWGLLAVPIVYAVTWVHARVFVWDKRRTHKITLAGHEFVKDDILNDAGRYALVLKSTKESDYFSLVVYALEDKNVNVDKASVPRIKYWKIHTSYKIRTFFS